MSTFEVDNQNDLSMMITKYEELYLKELTYYGTSDMNQMIMLMSIGQIILKLENNILENYYNPYVSKVKKNSHISEIYYLQKILFCSFNIIIKMVSLFVENKTNSFELEFKNKYLVDMLENYVEKFIEPILKNIDFIVSTNKVFELENPVNNLEKFINQNKNNFESEEKIMILEKIIKIMEQS